ncbi:sugar transferase [Actinoplanes regularis]|uniref:Undecaprenyl-phosphate galactose phosphotransferase, WbaP/exopolysaccharide biosynthesis polyprenyl glycosylphosphotransferase n=1 Tax=Actinoplanes regularis TaxID=52697 RepID=A0A239E3C5_9ACTN|nr:sugar transferase [Actinoplanes regularis]GIE88890.1 polyprenyl glycosylphosphotransferase [Actinoplanes regularis]GLW35707.1 polyprenyl glycosylphosphotransferase [Actinoplanes regularis]SNS38493.1 Undecaprenyl-phosphate galactose phosphotransferase, WbaP/exopolysaccharide biosynthesis polyprenyl glycosylphosphotransferase [Actinoplanes regularis]
MQTIESLSTVDLSDRASQARRGKRAGETRAGWQNRYARMLYLIDYVVGFGAACWALVLRFGPDGDEPNMKGYVLLTALLPIAWVVCLSANRAYEPRHLFVGTDEYARVFRSGVGLTAVLAIASFAFDLRLARGYVSIALPLAIAVDLGARYLYRQRLHRSWGRGDRLHRVLLVGHEKAVSDMTRRLRRERYHGLGVIGAVLPVTPSPKTFAAGMPPVYGTFDSVDSAVTRADADTVIVLACPEIDGPALRRLAWQLERDDIDLIVASTLVDVAGDRTTIRPVDGLPMLHVEHPKLKGSARFFKATFDRVGALTLLVLLSPLLLVVAGLVMFGRNGRGPAIFKQERVGKDGRTFMLYKFRTMVVDAEARLAELKELNEHDGELFKIRADPRITPIGQWLRRFSVDELPQLLNVVKGDMSLVGPRPPLAREVAGYPSDMLRRLVVKPGLTGLWQVSGRSDLSWEESIRLDLSYVENWSLAMDLAILFRTVSAVVRSSGAY